MTTETISIFGVHERIELIEQLLEEEKSYVEWSDENEIKSLEKKLAYLKTLDTEKEIHTLEEYFNFLDELDEICDFNICNNGRAICLD